MTFKPVKRSTFFRDVEREGRYLHARSPQVADRFLDAVEATTELLISQPWLGHEAGFRRAVGFRSLQVTGFKNYLVFYKIRGEEIVFSRLVHGARDLPQLIRKD